MSYCYEQGLIPCPEHKPFSHKKMREVSNEMKLIIEYLKDVLDGKVTEDHVNSPTSPQGYQADLADQGFDQEQLQYQFKQFD